METTPPDEQNTLPPLQGSNSLAKLMDWENMALSSLLAILTKWHSCDNFEMSICSRPDVATRIWLTLKFELPEFVAKHPSRRTRYISGSSLEILKNRLIKCLDREQVCKTRLGLNNLDETDEQPT